MKAPQDHLGESLLNLRNPPAVVATVFGAGLLPGAPGTWGALAALPCAWALQAWAAPWGLPIAVVGVVLLGLWSIGRVIGGAAGEDPGAVVIDEVAGQWITLLVAPLDPLFYLAGFLLFRIIDIVKPWPVSWADRTVKGALGVMLDDVLAGLYAAAALAVVVWWAQ